MTHANHEVTAAETHLAGQHVPHDKGLGRVYFLRHRDQIAARLQEGFPAKTLWRELRQSGQMPIMYCQFMCYCRHYIQGQSGQDVPAAATPQAPVAGESQAPETVAGKPPPAGQPTPVEHTGPRRLPPPAQAADAFRHWTGRVDNVEQFKAAIP